MPIYAYKCETCGLAKDVLQKMSDPVLTDCPACGSATFKKQLTAAGFQLKGTGWYVTDFREGGGAKSAPAVEPKSDANSAVVSPASSSGDTGSAAAAPSTSSATSAATAPASSTGSAPVSVASKPASVSPSASGA